MVSYYYNYIPYLYSTFSYIGIRSKVLYNFKSIIMNDIHVNADRLSNKLVTKYRQILTT